MTTQAKKARLREQREMEKCEIDDFCKQHKLEQEYITEYQIHIENVIDIYPTGKKYFLLKEKKWGMYNFTADILKLLPVDN